MTENHTNTPLIKVLLTPVGSENGFAEVLYPSDCSYDIAILLDEYDIDLITYGCYNLQSFIEMRSMMNKTSDRKKSTNQDELIIKLKEAMQKHTIFGDQNWVIEAFRKDDEKTSPYVHVSLKSSRKKQI